MFEEFVEELKSDLLTHLKSGELGNAVVPLWSDKEELWKSMDMVLIGVPDGRDAGKNTGAKMAPDAIRKALYRLSGQSSKLKLGDLGNIRPGHSPSDTGAALQYICEELLKEGIIPVVLGGAISLSYAQYKAFQPVVKSMETTFLAPRFELEEDNYLSKICLHEPNYLFNVNILGYQSYYVNPNSLQTFEKMYFNAMRLGILRNNLQESEPIIRNTQLFCIDMGVVKQADAPGNYYNNPNGLNSEDVCQLCWYAGVSDSLRSFGIYEVNPDFDYRDQTCKLAAQMIWYFFDGYYNRKGDLPGLHTEFLKYRCTLNGNHEDVIFYKSKRSERWWMQLGETGSEVAPMLIPCSYADYQLATHGEMPDRYWKAIQKLV